jgi:hypothetical protein
MLWPSINGHLLGVFFGGQISLKNRTYCPLLATIQALSKTRVFLLRARSEWNHTRYPKYITGTDRLYCSRKDCFKLVEALQRDVSSDVPLFCSNISTVSTNQLHLSNNMSTFLLTRGRYSYDLISEIDSLT